MVIHHLPGDERQRCFREMRRVLKPGGRLLAVDFGGARQKRRGLIAHFHRHHRFDLMAVESQDVTFRVRTSSARRQTRTHGSPRRRSRRGATARPASCRRWRSPRRTPRPSRTSGSWARTCSSTAP
jgi:SAM-dependent methyltransferase